MRKHIALAGVLAALGFHSGSAIAQASGDGAAATGTSAAYVPTMTFDVASVRENKEADLRQGITMSGQFTPHTTNLRLVNWRIESILSDAYGIDEWQVVGAPKWPFPTVFIIEAKGDAEADAKIAGLPADEQRLEQEHMLEALLADRFKLKAHWETREGDVFSLVVAKGGPKMQPPGSLPLTQKEKEWMTADSKPRPLHQENDGHGYDFVGHSCPLDYLVGMLSSQFGRPVIDKTGLTGKYDFIVTYHSATDRDRRADDTDPTLPQDSAIKAQLGLQLQPAKGPVRVLVIDHIEKPTEN